MFIALPDRKDICATCGFLSLRRNRDGEFVEAPDSYRVIGTTLQVEPLQMAPVCFAMRKFLLVEVANELAAIDPEEYGPEDSDRGFSPAALAEAQQFSTKEGRDALSRVLDRDRPDCSWVKWRQGFTPKEHQEMLDRQFVMSREDRRDRWALIARVVELALIAGTVAVAIWAITTAMSVPPAPTLDTPAVQPSVVPAERP